MRIRSGGHDPFSGPSIPRMKTIHKSAVVAQQPILVTGGKKAGMRYPGQPGYCKDGVVYANGFPKG